jgi:tRNA-Thr(GGU) m(6)t(6)A37 methyltransferase TsaA
MTGSEYGHIVLRPIGRVVEAGGERQVIEVDPAYAAGLDGIEGEEHLWVLFWMHELTDADRTILHAHPMGDPARPETGVFALHSPYRPNPIGMTRVRLLQRDRNRLTVADLDALAGSPVLDIKSG